MNREDLQLPNALLVCSPTPLGRPLGAQSRYLIATPRNIKNTRKFDIPLFLIIQSEKYYNFMFFSLGPQKQAASIFSTASYNFMASLTTPPP